MEKQHNNFLINTSLLIFCIATIFSGLLIQINYHMGYQGNIDISKYVLGISYKAWSDLHKISIVVLSVLMIFHIYRHWKWYKIVILKKLITKNLQLIILTVLFILVAITGYIPWFIDLLKGDLRTRHIFIEIHDTLALILTVFFILHIVKRIKWYYTTFVKIIK